eukprot:180542-Chlamydomonas_euryale.AAC.2
MSAHAAAAYTSLVRTPKLGGGGVHAGYAWHWRPPAVLPPLPAASGAAFAGDVALASAGGIATSARCTGAPTNSLCRCAVAFVCAISGI